MTARRKEPRGPVDWAAVRDRLARAVAATERASELSPRRARELLDERARALARARAPRREPQGIEVLCFEIAGEHYAIETRFVREVVRLPEVTPVPGVPDFIRGVAGRRGRILPVVDIRTFLKIAPKGAGDLSRLIVLGAEGGEFAIAAGEASMVTRLREDELLAPSGPAEGVAQESVRGITRDARLVVDGAALLRDARWAAGQG